MAHFLKGILMAGLFFSQLEAKDLGVYGATSSISEEDLISYLQEKLKNISEDDQQELIKSMQSNLIDQIKKPMEIKGIQKVKSYSLTYFDPSIYVNYDILNHEGQIIVKKGTQFNPLSQVSLQDLLFFDATDPAQLSWAKSLPPSFKWILVKGQPMQLEETLNRPIYFDQEGILSKKFGIQQVPAYVSQEGLKIKIEFIPVGGHHA